MERQAVFAEKKKEDEKLGEANALTGLARLLALMIENFSLT
jgi:hypothetical protein